MIDADSVDHAGPIMQVVTEARARSRAHGARRSPQHTVSRNQRAGTRILIDRLLGNARPDGYWTQLRSHNAVATAVAQSRADWGVAIAAVAHAFGFIPLAEEHYVLVTARTTGRRSRRFSMRWPRRKLAPRF